MIADDDDESQAHVESSTSVCTAEAHEHRNARGVCAEAFMNVIMCGTHTVWLANPFLIIHICPT